MTFPFWVIRNAWLPRRFGFQAQTVGPWIFFPSSRIDLRVLRHETLHVAQFWIGWILGLAAWAIVQPGWWWLIATPLTHLAAYTVVGLVGMCFGRSFYHDNPFERAARKHAGEPVE